MKKCTVVKWENIMYEIHDIKKKYAEVISYDVDVKNPVHEVVIPCEVNGVPVTTIGSMVFRNSPAKRIVIPDTLTTIRDSAFWNSSLEEIDLKNVRNLGQRAFIYCFSLRSVKLSKCLKKIPTLCFANSGLEEVFIPENVKEIEDVAFSSCQELKRVHIAKGVKLIGAWCFHQCDDLEEVIIENPDCQIRKGAFEGCPKLCG